MGPRWLWAFLHSTKATTDDSHSDKLESANDAKVEMILCSQVSRQRLSAMHTILVLGWLVRWGE